MKFVRHFKFTGSAAVVISVVLLLFPVPGQVMGDSTAQSWVDKGLETSKTKPDSDEEAACYRRAIEVDPKMASAHFNLAFVLDTQVQQKWRGADTAWVDLDTLYEALDHYVATIDLDPAREDAHTNVIRITKLLLETPTKRPPDIQALRMRLLTCQEATNNARAATQTRAKEMDRLILEMEKQISNLKAAKPSDKLVSAAEITRCLTRRFTRGQSPYHGPRVPLLIHFDLDKDTIRPDSAAQLHQVAESLKGQELAGIIILIEGHTDTRGSIDHNQDLSQRRAESVKHYLVQKGIPESRFKTRGFGKSRPLVPEDSDTHLSMNRRVEFVNDGELVAHHQRLQEQKKREAGSIDVYDLLN